MSCLLSEPIETLIADRSCDDFSEKCDVLIVGSGYGGSIAAMRLAKEGRKVWVFERGNEYMPGDFPESLGDLPGHVRLLHPGHDVPIGYAGALFDFRIGDTINFLVGNGLGGTSLINANVALEPDPDIFKDPRWPEKVRKQKERLLQCCQEVRKLLGVNDAKTEKYPKYAALKKVAKSLGKEGECCPAPLTVTQTTGPNAVGITQSACIGCANCVTGCNTGAKNTLAMNALPLAKSRGAELYTGVSVLSVEPVDCENNDGSQGWRVRFRVTEACKGVFQQDVFTLHARVVILAAGTLGSTEILLRSQARGAELGGGVRFSDQLGERLSGNGDTLAFGYAQKEEVNAVAHAEFDKVTEPRSNRGIGPTITGYFKKTPDNADPAAQRHRQVTVEDSAVPEALAQIFGEIITTAALPRRYVKDGLPAWFDGKPTADPLAVHPGALRHSQMLLIMGDDEAQWKVKLGHTENVATGDHDQATLHILPGASAATRDEKSVFSDVDRMLETAEREKGFDGGHYLPNPLWKFMPDKLSALTNVPPPQGQLLSVHPLGGCVMGENPNTGVVDGHGRVFNGNAAKLDFSQATTTFKVLAKDIAEKLVYKGLYVMDGAVIPRALGVNPLLTISALAYLNAEHVDGYLRKPETPSGGTDVAPGSCPGLGRANSEIIEAIDCTIADNQKDPDPAPAHQVHAEFNECLVGQLSVDTVPKWLADRLSQNAGDVAKLAMNNRLVVSIKIDIPDIVAWLRDPNNKLRATAKLFRNLAPAEMDTIDDLQLQSLAEGNGNVRLLALDRPGLQCRWRAALAVCKFFVRRTEDLVRQLFSPSKESRCEEVKQFWRVALNHGNWRRLHYCVEFKTAHGKTLKMEGTKYLAYAAGLRAPWRDWRAIWTDLASRSPWATLKDLLLLRVPWHNPWNALVDLPIELSDGRNRVTGVLRVDLVRLSQRSPLQVIKSPNEPVTVATMISAGMMTLRTLFQTHFWSFGAPDYPKQPILPVPNPEQGTANPRDPGPVEARGDVITPEFVTLTVRKFPPAPAPTIEIRLAHYRRPGADKGSLLFVHGLAHSSMVFATDTVKTNLARYFCRQGYDVWLLDHRLSIALPDETSGRWLAENPWDMDQTARADIGKAIQYIYKATGDQPVQVFAHCIGAGATAMAVLSGYCQAGEKESMIRSLVLHAVHPWLVPSVTNHLRNNVAAFVKNAISQRFFDVVPSQAVQVTAREMMFDRIAGSVPWRPLCEAARHRWETDPQRMGRQICSRMTLLYGYEWKHEHLTDETHRALATLVGIGNLEAYRQIYFILQQQRLTKRDGRNDYVRADNFDLFWSFPTLFAHGSDNKVFDPRSARQSAHRLDHLRGLSGWAGQRGERGVYWFEAKHYGHMDFLFGKNAKKDVYPRIDEFFEIARKAKDAKESGGERSKHLDLPPAPPPSQAATQPPACGPMIGWVRRSDTGNIVLRLWLEPYLATVAGVLVCKSGGDVSSPRDIPLPPDRYYPGIYKVYDVEVESDFAKDLNIALSPPDDPDTFGVSKSVKSIRFADQAKTEIELTGVEPQSASRSLADPDAELHGETGARIPLTRLPWFRRLQARDDGARAAFVVGSCHYPGSPFEADLSDRVFQGVLRHVEDSEAGEGIDHVLMVGDQIYADATTDIFDTREMRDHFSSCYRDAFGGKYLRRLLASVPTYMALDDHEFQDNYAGSPRDLALSGTVTALGLESYVDYALASAKAYQWCMSPGNPGNVPVPGATSATANDVEKLQIWRHPTSSSTDNGLWYKFSSGGLPFFVMDTRTERTVRYAHIGAQDARLVCDRQRQDLQSWLKELPSDMPKFIVSGCVLAPAPRTLMDNPTLWRYSDGWAGFPATWQNLVEYIVDNGIQNVVFISGDYHISVLAQLTLSHAGNSVNAYQIIASGFYAPLPFANEKPDDYDWAPKHSTLLPHGTSKAQITAKAYLLTTAYSHFLRVDATRQPGSQWSIAVRACGPDGKDLPLAQPVGGPFKAAGSVVEWEL
ncbi:MAG TPA: alpha/beta fold hydrolase [Burkholderiales bacterium]|nr:alpha/beta fold hydrolase [Burkholderiales bacterium]